LYDHHNQFHSASWFEPVEMRRPQTTDGNKLSPDSNFRVKVAIETLKNNRDVDERGVNGANKNTELVVACRSIQPSPQVARSLAVTVLVSVYPTSEAQPFLWYEMGWWRRRVHEI
jgi:hypothetical protein